MLERFLNMPLHLHREQRKDSFISIDYIACDIQKGELKQNEKLIIVG